MTADAFTVENNLLTPTMKLKRNDTKIKYSAELEALYKAIEAQDKANKEAGVTKSKL